MIVLELWHAGFWLCNMLDAVNPVLLMRCGILQNELLALWHSNTMIYTQGLTSISVQGVLVNCLERFAC